MIKAVILDFDGVIVESVDIKTEAFRALFAQYTDDLGPVVDYHLRNNGVSRFIKFRYIWEDILQKKYDDRIRDKLGRQFSRIVAHKVIGCPFVPGAVDFLKYFSKKVPLYIASAVPAQELSMIVDAKGIDGYFAGLYGYPPVTKSEAIVDVMKRESASSKEILYVGDSIQDLEAASERGVSFIARRNKEDFMGHHIPIFDDMGCVMDYIRKLR